MRTNLDDDPKHLEPEPPYHFYGLVFIIGLAVIIGIGWLLNTQSLRVIIPRLTD